MAYTPENYHEALGALKVTRELLKDCEKILTELRGNYSRDVARRDVALQQAHALFEQIASARCDRDPRHRDFAVEGEKVCSTALTTEGEPQ